MQSQAFIREAKQLIADIKGHQANAAPDDQEFINLQRRVSRLFQDMQNPSLIAAADLRDVALAAGMRIENSVLVKIEHGEQMHLG